MQLCWSTRDSHNFYFFQLKLTCRCNGEVSSTRIRCFLTTDFFKTDSQLRKVRNYAQTFLTDFAHWKRKIFEETFLDYVSCWIQYGIIFKDKSGETPYSIFLFKVNNRNNIKKCEVCSKFTIKTPEQRHWHRSGVFIVNFEYILHLFLVFLLLALNK